MKNLTLSTAIFAAIYSSSSVATELTDVFVSAGHSNQNLHSVTASAEVITATEIEDNHYRTLSDALNSVNGLSIVRNGGLGNTTSALVRGQSTKNLLVLIDGTEMTNPMGTGGAILGNLLLSNVERIEILKGPQSGIWGANASSGVVNIITKKSQQGLQGTVIFERGSFKQQKLAGQLASANEQGDFALSFSKVSTDGFSSIKQANQNHDRYENDAFKQTDFNLNAGININKQHRIETSVANSDGYSEYDYSSNPNQADYASVNYLNTRKKLQYVYQNANYQNRIFVSQNEIQQYSSAVTNSYGIKGGMEYAAGHNLDYVATQTQYQNETSGEDYNNLGLGLTNTNRFNQDSLIVTASVRSDQFDNFDDKITGKLGVKNHFSDQVFIGANYGTAYNAPTLFQQTYGATSELQPEEVSGYDITLGAYGLELTYYRTETENLIQYGGTWPNDLYENLSGTSKFEGVEAQYGRYFDSLNTNINLQFAQGTAKDDNNQWLARRAEQTIGLNLLYDGFNKLDIGVNTQYQGKTYDQANEQGAQIGEYFVTDLNVNYFASDSVTLYAQVLNLFGEDYTQAVATYETDGVTPQNVYSNGGTQLHFGIQGKL